MKYKLFAFFCVLALLFGCTLPGGEKNLVPSKANFVLTMKVADFFSDADVQELIKEQSEDIEEELQDTYEETGIDVKKMTKIVLFGDSSSFSGTLRTTSSSYGAGIIYGQFDQAKVISKIKENEAIKEQSYEGVTLYVDEDTESATAFVEGAVVAGTPSAVKDVIDVSKGKQQALSNAKLNAVTENIDSAGMVSLVAIIPEESRQQMASSPSSGPVNTQQFSKVGAVGLSVNKQASNINVKVALLADDAASAGKVEDVLSGLVSMGKGFAKPGSSMEALLEKVAVSSSGSIIKVSLTTTKSELEALNKEIAELSAPSYVNTYPTDDSDYVYPDVPPAPEE